MHITFGRRSRLTALGAGLITAAALAVSSAGPALADTADTGGSASLAIPDTFLVGLAKSAIIVLPESPVTSSDATGADTYTLPGHRRQRRGQQLLRHPRPRRQHQGRRRRDPQVRRHHRHRAELLHRRPHRHLPGRRPSTPPWPTSTATCPQSSSAGPPATETFSCDELDLSAKAATALNTGLGTKAFKRGTSVGAFTTTFDVTIS